MMKKGEKGKRRGRRRRRREKKREGHSRIDAYEHCLELSDDAHSILWVFSLFYFLEALPTSLEAIVLGNDICLLFCLCRWSPLCYLLLFFSNCSSLSHCCSRWSTVLSTLYY